MVQNILKKNSTKIVPRLQRFRPGHIVELERLIENTHGAKRKRYLLLLLCTSLFGQDNRGCSGLILFNQKSQKAKDTVFIPIKLQGKVYYTCVDLILTVDRLRRDKYCHQSLKYVDQIDDVVTLSNIRSAIKKEFNLGT